MMKIFASHEFGYRRITVERPLRLSAQITDEAVAGLRYAPKPYNAVMRWMVEKFGTDCHMTLADNEEAIRARIKKDFKELKEKQIKEVLNDKLWLFQRGLMEKAQTLQNTLYGEEGTELSNDFNQFDKDLKAADLKLDAKEKKQFLDAVTCKEAIDADLDAVSTRIMSLLQEVHS